MDGKEILVDNPTNFPPASDIDVALEPFVKTIIITPEEFNGGINKLCSGRFYFF